MSILITLRPSHLGDSRAKGLVQNIFVGLNYKSNVFTPTLRANSEFPGLGRDSCIILLLLAAKEAAAANRQNF